MRRRQSSPTAIQASLTPERLKQLNQLQTNLHVHFHDISILNEACTHRSYANETRDYIGDNERLEFLGDSVLGLITAEFLYEKYKDLPEGILAKWKSKLVSGPVLSVICKDLDLIPYLRFGKGEKESGQTNRRVMENLVEALLGALYLDQGLETCKKFILPHLKRTIKDIEDLESVKDYKSILQEKSQKKFKKVPQYELISQTGPDHDKIFCIRVTLPDGFSTTGEGKNKRSAEHSAAKRVLAEWRK